MIIDELKLFLTNFYSNAENNISPIKKFEETFMRSIIHFKDKAMILETEQNLFNLEMVDNNQKSWKTLESFTFDNKKDLFDKIGFILISKERTTTKQRVSLKKERLLDFIKKNQNKPISYKEMSDKLNIKKEEINRILYFFKKKRIISETQNIGARAGRVSRVKSYLVM